MTLVLPGMNTVCAWDALTKPAAEVGAAGSAVPPCQPEKFFRNSARTLFRSKSPAITIVMWAGP